MAALSLVAAGSGGFDPSIYDGLVTDAIRPGVFTQDLVAIALSVVLGLLAFSGRSHPIRKRVVAHGILGFFFYAYGIYAIERIYNAFYPLYLILFGGSLFVLIHSVASVPNEATDHLTIPWWARLIGAGYGLLIAVMFNVIWFSALVPLLESGHRIDHMYSIYVIDLSFVMPAFVIASVLAWHRHPVGLMGLPSLFVLGVGILSPLALAEWIKPLRYGLPRDVGGLGLYGALAATFLILAFAFLVAMRTRSPDAVRDAADASPPPSPSP
jgi:hypothetical protein